MIQTIRVKRLKNRYQSLLDDVDQLEDDERFREALEKWRTIEEVLSDLIEEEVEVEKNRDLRSVCRDRIEELEFMLGEVSADEADRISVKEGREEEETVVQSQEKKEETQSEEVTQSEEEMESEEEEKSLEDILDEDAETLDGDLKEAKQILQESELNFEVLNIDIDFSDIGGRERVKSEVEKYIFPAFRDQEGVEKYNILEAPEGVLFYGPPGTGKTYFTKGICGELDANVIKIHGSNIKNRYVGESEKNVKALFDLAECLAPCIIVCQEVEALTSKRGKHDSKISDDIAREFLDAIENTPPQVMVMGTTNQRESEIDEAFLRPGRFTEQYEIGLPDVQTRLEVLKVQLSEMGHFAESDVDLRTLANSTEYYSCADLELIVRKATWRAYHKDKPVTQEDLRFGLDQVSPSVEDW